MEKLVAIITSMSVPWILACCQQAPSLEKGHHDPRFQGEFTLYRLDGDRYPFEPVPEGSETLHGWTILQACHVDSMAAREELIQAVDVGIAEGGGIPVDCFNPRHAFQVEASPLNMVYMICFECRNYEIWNGEDLVGGGMISTSPGNILDRYLDRCQDQR